MAKFENKDILMQQLKIKQKNKANKLKNYVYIINKYVAQLNEINTKIDRANLCIQLSKSIPGEINPVTLFLGSAGMQAQQGLFIDGTPVGENITSSATAILGNIESSCNAIVTKTTTFADDLTVKGQRIKMNADNIRNDYKSLLYQDPIDLGEYGPAPLCPLIPEVKSIGE